jgi:3-methylcrotonyl-CoA carboxylase alpha subunit
VKRLILKIDGREKKVTAMKHHGRLWVHVDGDILVREASGHERRLGSSRGSAMQAELVVAPMPGRILKVQAVAGQAVRKGDVLIAMEAMKMEYALQAEKDGRVRAVLVKQGDTVALGMVLVELD